MDGLNLEKNLDKRKRQFDDDAEGGKTTQWVTFMLDGEKYGIDVLTVQEIIRMTDITPVPGAGSHVLGVINLRGNVVPIIDLRLRFNLLEKESDGMSRIIVVEQSRETLGMVVDAVAEVVTVPDAEVEPSPSIGEDVRDRFLMGVARREKDLLILVNVVSILEEEKQH